MKVYELNSYQELIDSYILEQKSLGNKITYQSLSVQLRIQKSYLSKVMNRNASLNRDQGFLLSKAMRLSRDETDFLFLLIDLDRCGISEYKAELIEKIKKIQLRNTQSDKYLNKSLNLIDSNLAQEYYLLPEIQLVHLSLSIPEYQKDFLKLKTDLGISSEIFSYILETLEKLKLVSKQNSEIKLLKSNLHLKNDSPFFHQWRTGFLLKSLEKTKSLAAKDKYNFIASFTCDDESKELIRLEYMKFLNKVEKYVSKAPSKGLYQMNFDLFKWL